MNFTRRWRHPADAENRMCVPNVLCLLYIGLRHVMGAS